MLVSLAHSGAVFDVDMANNKGTKTALVTGAASGIGKGIVERLHAGGYAVVLADIQDEVGESVAAQLGERASYHHLDVTDEAQWDTVLSEIAREQSLELVVNNAGIGAMASIEETDLAMWQSIFAVNSTGVYLGCRKAIEYMNRDRDSSIINIASALGKKALAGTCAYSATKAAVISLTESTALHCAEQGYRIRCNAILPGFIETPLLLESIAANEDPEAMLGYFTGLHPVGRIGRIEEVADAAFYLASEAASFVTGIAMPVDGGMTL